MKAIKKWLFDKEGLFIIITWWSIALVIFSIILGTSIKGVVSNSKITADTIDGYVHEFIEQGDNITPYNENVVSTAVGIQNGEYFLNVREYAHRYTKPCSEKFEISGTGTGTSAVTVEYGLECVDSYYIMYNYTSKTLTIELLKQKEEIVQDAYPIKINQTDSKAIHVLWNNQDTGVEINKGEAIKVGKEGKFVVINGKKTNVNFYEIDSETNKEIIEYSEEKPTESTLKQIDFELVVEYKNNADSYTTKKYDLSKSTFNDTEKLIVDNCAEYFTQIIEGSIGIKTSAFTLLIVSAVVDSLLIIGGIVGIILIKRSKDE